MQRLHPTLCGMQQLPQALPLQAADRMERAAGFPHPQVLQALQGATQADGDGAEARGGTHSQWQACLVCVPI